MCFRLDTRSVSHRRAGSQKGLPVAIVVMGICGTAAAQQPSIVGTWEWTRKANGCTERYVFRDNGTLAVTSGDESTENVYRMSWTPEPTGRYKVTVKTVKDHGGRDCADSLADDTGLERVLYILFGGSQQTMIACGTPAGPDCIGPLRRAAP
ncbi:MAG TPA: hypothetical protein VFR86_02830 [Burkholderiaceae bacterium]|nr:hypothetical protein [Burkholderiaceae bacterium]